MNKQETIILTRKALATRRKILQLIVSGNASHIGSSYSVVEILVYLYDHFLNVNPKKPKDEKRDIFILSKGWAVSALYTILSMKGFFSDKKLSTYCKNGSSFIGSATRNGIPGIEATTGSMGHGLPIAVGFALAAKLQKKQKKVVVMISDGECDEGATWEALLQAGNYHLDNLLIIVDYNKWQSFGRVKDILDLEPLSKKFEAFKASVKEINGHDFLEIHDTIAHFPFAKNKPSVLIAHTIKGKGISVFENKNEWHYKTPRDKELEIAKKELDL